MSARVRPYKGARLVASYTCERLPSGRWEGQSGTVRLWEDYGSQGYKSGYEQVPLAWLEIETSGGMRQCWRYSGKRTAEAAKHYAKNVAELQKAEMDAERVPA